MREPADLAAVSRSCARSAGTRFKRAQPPPRPSTRTWSATT